MDATSYPQVLEQLRARCSARDYAKGDAVFRHGDPARAVYYLLTEGSPAGELELNFTLTQWADLLGLTRETLYRTLARLEERGELTRSGHRLRLTDSRMRPGAYDLDHRHRRSGRLRSGFEPAHHSRTP
ncbi:helix-turn-helix domain-containing protein [Thioalkalivibrio sulfidiphilus]|uniref:helix-turn-helix domain-containing protein n=1 Tax=Thioalkalivibrio sulfidiphilus TaxID=1033854 RepID=UPI00036DD166|nr:helix-turn-helix domain-containing protein [Thioalkalivibrio sulfidiphilus]